MAQLAPEVQADLAQLFVQLSHNPKTRKIIAKAVKDANPDSPHAQAFADVDLEDKFENFKSEQEQDRIERQQEQVIERMNRQRQQLLSGGDDGEGRKYSEDDVKNIESLMTRKGISDYEDGATLYAATLPPVDPRPPSDIPAHGATWEFPEFAKFGADPNKAARDTAHQVITELMRKR